MEEMLLHTDNFDAAIAEIESVGGRVTLLFGNDLLVAKVPKHFIDKKKSFASASAHIAESASPETLLFVQAYWMAREKKTKPQPPVQLWTKETAPGPLPQKSPLIGEANSPYPQTMTGKVAVGLHMISGPGSLAISDAERISVVSAVTTGYQFWASFAPNYANLQFHLIHAHITVATADIGTCYSYNHCEDGFTNDALNAIGYPSGQAGKDALAQFYKSIPVQIVHTWFSLRNTICIGLSMHIVEGDPFTWKSVIIGWTNCLPTKLVMFSMLLMNMIALGANAMRLMAREAALQKITTVCHVVTFRPTAS